MAKLQPDYINWVIKINASQAQEEYHKLSKANKELAAQNNAGRRAMAELEKQGRKGSQEWKNLRNSITGNNRAMAENRAKMDELFKRFDTGSMTLKELRKRLRELQREFENTSKAANPKEYERLRQQILQTRGAIEQAKRSTIGLKESFFSVSKLKESLIGFFFNIGQTVFGTINKSFSNFFNIIVDFEAQNSKLAAILKTNVENIQELTKAARKLGATTSYSAAEVAGLQIELAKLGFLQDDILAMEEDVMK
ncbi:MAG: phage tail tape measure protein, partial [Muribaculaceae bacterium]|nr:phage tail tape measure protein [Muribaculaceae bacterium]